MCIGHSKETVIAVLVPSTMTVSGLVSLSSARELLKYPYIIEKSFKSSLSNLKLYPRNGEVEFSPNTLLNMDLNNDGVLDSIGVDVEYDYKVPEPNGCAKRLMSEENTVNILGKEVTIQRYDSDEEYPWTLAKAELIYGVFSISIWRNRFSKKIHWHVAFRGFIYINSCPHGECDSFANAAEDVNAAVKTMLSEMSEIVNWAKM